MKVSVLVSLGAALTGGGLALLTTPAVDSCDVETLIVAYLLGWILPQPSKVVRKDDGEGDDDSG